MSTRGLMGFRLNGKDKLVYNHSSSYPRGLGDRIGNDLALILRTPGKGEQWLRDKVEDLQLVDSDTVPTPEQIERLKPFTNLGVADKSEKDWYCLTHDLQGDLENTLQAGIAEDSGNFIHDSLFCEWAYIVNLDTRCLEVYKGFQRKPHTNGRYAVEKPNGMNLGVGTYYSCALVKEVPFERLCAEILRPEGATDSCWVDEVLAEKKAAEEAEAAE